MFYEVALTGLNNYCHLVMCSETPEHCLSGLRWKFIETGIVSGVALIDRSYSLSDVVSDFDCFRVLRTSCFQSELNKSVSNTQMYVFLGFRTSRFVSRLPAFGAVDVMLLLLFLLLLKMSIIIIIMPMFPQQKNQQRWWKASGWFNPDAMAKWTQSHVRRHRCGQSGQLLHANHVSHILWSGGGSSNKEEN